MSAAAVGWFLLRVIPKPIRATYPCQQAAFPLASAFVVWLLALKSGLLAWLNLGERVRQLRPALVRAGLLYCFVLAALAAGQTARYLDGWKAAWSPSDPPNSPMGAAKGIFPGRVVWARDAYATPWDGVTGHWWDDDTGVNQAAAEQMVSGSLQALTGATTDAEAWDKIFRYYNNTHGRGDIGYQPSETIAIKINCNNCYDGNSDVDNQVDAAPQTVLAMLRQLVNQAGVAQQRIFLYEGVRFIPSRILNKCRTEFPDVVWIDSAGTNGICQQVAWHVNAFRYSARRTGCGTSVPEAVYQATYLVNISLLKGHWHAGVSLTAKNHLGSIDAIDHKYIDAYTLPMGSYSPFVDLIGTRQLGGKTILFMADGLYGVRQVTDVVNAANASWNNLFGGQWSASYFMSLDPVAIDSVGLDFLLAEFGDTLGGGNHANCDNYLHEAASANAPPSGVNYRPDGTTLSSLGVHEHWNNSVAKQYSGNLGATNGIQLVKLAEAPHAPIITVQPSSQSAPAGSDAAFNVAASGTAPLNYQWLRSGAALTDGGNISGATAPTLSLATLQTNDASDYQVVITNLLGAVTSSVATLTVTPPGDCMWPPAGLVGWWPGEGNANDIADTNHGALQGGAAADAAGMVRQAFSFDGTNTYVQIPDSPVHKPSTLTVECWVKFNNLDAPGTSTYVGQQYLVFKQNSRPTDFEGYVLSKDRTVGDIILWEVTSAAGQLVRIDSVSQVTTNVWYHLAGVRGSDYIQLYFNGQLEAQTNVDFPQDYGTWPLYFGTSGQAYWDRKLNGVLDEVSLYNRALSAGEIAALYAAGSAGKCRGSGAPAVLIQPQNQTAVLSSNAGFNVTAFGLPPLSYQWRFEGADLDGATSTNLTIGPVQTSDAGNYNVVVSNSIGSATSAVAVLTVLVPPTITDQPESRTNSLGSVAVFHVLASGTPPLSYQWRKNGSNLSDGDRLSGATAPTCSLTAVQTTDAGAYDVVVSSTWGVVTSALAILTVEVPLPIIHSPGGLGFGGDGFGFDLSGPGLVVVIEASSDLVNWAAIQTNALINGQAHFVDLQAESLPKGFYRACFILDASLLTLGASSRGDTSNQLGSDLSGIPLERCSTGPDTVARPQPTSGDP